MYALTTRTRLGDVCTVMTNGARVCSASPTEATAQLPSRLPGTFHPGIPFQLPPGSTRPIAGGVTSPAHPATAPQYQPSSSGYRSTGTGARRSRNTSSSSSSSLNNQALQNGGMNLAQLQALANTNPSALTPAQVAILQAAGTIASTVPYSSASQIATSAAPTDTTVATAAPASTFDLSALYGGVPLWGWLAGAGVAAVLIFKKK